LSGNVDRLFPTETGPSGGLALLKASKGGGYSIWDGFPAVDSARRLTAVMFTDMVGYTASTHANEAAALALRREHEELVNPVFTAHQGRTIKSTGDGFLVEFDSALRATECAVGIQRKLHERNEKAGTSPIQLRIGIHLGDVERQGSDIFGDAVNIASRIESVAEPGGICLSGSIYEQVHNKIPDRLEKLPRTALKGIGSSIEIYRLVLPWNGPRAPAAIDGPSRLAVLPFTNMSPDPSDVFFADGLTEELITVISHVQELRVIARTSVMQYKSTVQDVSQIGANLGVNWILEGSVRRAGNRLRITAQLIDVASQVHAWSQSYDREIEDVFAVQSEIAKQVADALKIELRPSETARLAATSPVQMDSYLAYLKGRSVLESEYSEKNFRAAKQQFELALSLDPSNARAHSGVADSLMLLKWGRFQREDDGGGSAIRAHVMQALALDPQLPEAHSSLGDILWDEAKHLEAEKEFKLALTLNPSYAPAHYSYAHLLLTFNRPEEALARIVLAVQLDPNSFTYGDWHMLLLIMLRRLDEAFVVYERLQKLNPESTQNLDTLAFYHYARGDLDKILPIINRLEASWPKIAMNLRIWLLAAQGNKDDARKLIAQQEALPELRDPARFAVWHAITGDLDGCFRLLNEAWDTKALAIQVWRIEPTFEPVRQDPRFNQLLRRMDLPL